MTMDQKEQRGDPSSANLWFPRVDLQVGLQPAAPNHLRHENQPARARLHSHPRVSPQIPEEVEGQWQLWCTSISVFDHHLGQLDSGPPGQWRGHRPSYLHATVDADCQPLQVPCTDDNPAGRACGASWCGASIPPHPSCSTDEPSIDLAGRGRSWGLLWEQQQDQEPMRPTLEKHSVIGNVKKNWVQVVDESGAPATQVSLHLAYFLRTLGRVIEFDTCIWL